MSLINNLNPNQQEAVLHTQGPLLILAGAGSGKTRVLTYRMANLILNGVDSFNILAVTFTNKAAREMRQRVTSLIDEDKGIWISTFHSLCVRILRKHIHNIGYGNNFTIYDSDDSQRLIKNCIKDINLNEKNFPIGSVMSEISRCKDGLLTPSEFEHSSDGNYRLTNIAKVYSLYQRRLSTANSLDFDDIIFKTVELFILHPDILQKYQSRFEYIMVDEYQDTNTAQYSLIKLLVGKNNNICVVGDDDQSIYGWRGANIRNIMDFEKDFPGAKTIKLEQNYRSTKAILNGANSVIDHNSNRKAKTLWTDIENGEKIKYFNGETDFEEARFIASTILSEVKNGAKLSDFGILYRANSISRVLEEALVMASIPYKIFGGVGFYSRREIKDIIAYLKCVYNPADIVSITRIINVPRRGIGAGTVEKVHEYAYSNDISFFSALGEYEKIEGLGNRGNKLRDFRNIIEYFIELSKSSPVSTLIQKIIDLTDYTKDLSADPDDAAERMENINELISKAVEYEKNTETPSLGEFLEEIALVADIDSHEDEDNTESLMTIHSAKGLKFPVVFIAAFEENVFPTYRSLSNESESALEEERRLCYVGITRAQNQLYLTSANKRRQAGQNMYNLHSRFLDEITPKLYENVLHSNTDGFKTISRQKKAAVPKGFSKPRPKAFSVPKDVVLDFEVGDMVKQVKYGIGQVTDICPAGADYEITVSFESGNKKFMAKLCKLEKV